MPTKAEQTVTINKLRADLDACRTKNSELTATNGILTTENTSLKSENQRLQAELIACQQGTEQPPPPPPPPPPTTTPRKGISVGGDFQNWSPTDRTRYLDAMVAAGASWIRVDFNYGAAAPGIAVAREVRLRGMKVLAVLIDRSRTTNADALSAFANAVIGEADAFEVWNEQNLNSFWSNPNPELYASIYNAVKTAIRSKRPGVPVVSGGLSPAPTNPPSSIAPAEYLKRAMAAGMQPDAIGWHPYCSPAFPGSTDGWSAWFQMTQTPEFKGGTIPFWATEFGAPTGGSGDAAIVTETVQKAMIVKAFEMWATYRATGPLFVYQGRDKGISTTDREDHYGLLRADWSPKPAFTSFKAVVA